jgi:hypothetical protein
MALSKKEAQSIAKKLKEQSEKYGLPTKKKSK